ncbi:MAG: hypothetical protein WA728_11075 [Xanthobacteraceae bacterium]
MGKDARGAAKREDEYYRSNPLQRCQVCGRLFVKRKEAICSRNCLDLLQAKQDLDAGKGIEFDPTSRR